MPYMDYTCKLRRQVSWAKHDIEIEAVEQSLNDPIGHLGVGAVDLFIRPGHSIQIGLSVI